MNKNSGFSNLQVFLLVVIAIILALLGGIFIGKNSNNQSDSDTIIPEEEFYSVSNEEFQERLSSSTGIEYTVEGEDSSEDQKYKAEVSTELKKLVTYLKENNSYIGVQVSDTDYDTYIYNKNNEVFLERTINGTNSVYLNDGSSYLIYNGTALETNDVDILAFVDIMADTINEDTSIVYKLDTTEAIVDNETNYEGYLLLNGWNKIYNFYSKVSEEYATDMVKSLMGETDGDCALLFDFRFSTDRKISIASLVIIPNEDSEFTTLTNWQFNGYELLDDWQLDNEWYTAKDVEDYDYTDLLESTYIVLEEIVGVNTEELDDSNNETESLDANNNEDELNIDTENIEDNE